MAKVEIRLILLMFYLLFSITACGVKNESLFPDEGEITVYTTMFAEQAEKYADVFRARYPDIRVNLVPLRTSALMERIINEKQNPRADVIWVLDASRLLLAQWNDLLIDYKPTGYERIDTQFRDTISPPFWVGIQGAVNVFCVNPEKIEELDFRVPRTWEDLLQPAYKGQIAMPNPNTTSTGYSMVTGWLLFYGERKGWSYIDQLDENMTDYTTSSLTACDMAAEGEIAIGLTYDDYALTKKRAVEESGGTLQVIFPSETFSWQLYGTALIRKEEVKPAAKIFLDWTISDDAFDQYAQDYGAIPARTDQPMREGFPKNVNGQLLNMEFPWAAANQNRIQREWSRRYK